MSKMSRTEFEEIPWTPVESSNVARVAWRETGKDVIDASISIGELFVEFRSSPGRAYRYENVPEALHADMLGAASVGSFFSHNVRQRFEGERVEVA